MRAETGLGGAEEVYGFEIGVETIFNDPLKGFAKRGEKGNRAIVGGVGGVFAWLKSHEDSGFFP